MLWFGEIADVPVWDPSPQSKAAAPADQRLCSCRDRVHSVGVTPCCVLAPGKLYGDDSDWFLILTSVVQTLLWAGGGREGLERLRMVIAECLPCDCARSRAQHFVGSIIPVLLTEKQRLPERLVPDLR